MSKTARASASSSWLEDHEHALLALGEHHLVGGHVQFALRHFFKVKTHAEAALVAHFNGGTGQASSAHVLDRDDGTGRHQFERRFHQALFGEGIADLHGGALFLDRVVEFGGGHGGAADAVAACFGAEVDDGHADARGGGVEDFVGLGEACGKGVDEAVAVVGRIEADFAADSGHAKAVAVAANARDNAVHQLAGLVVVGRAEATANSSQRWGARPW